MKALLALLLLAPAACFASLESVIGTELVDADGKPVETSSLKGKIIGLYFSASWCGPCRAFTPELVKARDKNDDEFEVVLVGADRSAEDQQKYMEDYEMEWPAIPFNSPLRQQLGKKFGISGIPALVILDDRGNLITKNGRAQVGDDFEAALERWQKAAGPRSDGD
jgi:nucleoredoxin